MDDETRTRITQAARDAYPPGATDADLTPEDRELVDRVRARWPAVQAPLADFVAIGRIIDLNDTW